MSKHAPTRKKVTPYDLYRRILDKPDLSDKEIDRMRTSIIMIAQAICEHVWKKKVY